MHSTKQITTTVKKNRNESKLLAEVAGLKENNRELAKSLSEKRKENIELKEMQTRYIILENKFKMTQELHFSSISRLETYLLQTSSQLFEVVESLSRIHKTIHQSLKRSVMLEDIGKNKGNKAIANGETETSEDTNIFEHVSNVLKKLTSNLHFGTLDEKEMNILSSPKISQEYKENDTVVKCKLESLPEVENDLIPEFKNGSNLREPKTLNSSKSDIYTCSQKEHIISSVAYQEFNECDVTLKPTNESIILDETSRLQETEITSISLNGAQHISLSEVENDFIPDFKKDSNLCEPQMLNSSKSDIYPCSQKEHIINSVAHQEFNECDVTIKPTNDSIILDETSQLEKTEITTINVNGAQPITDISTMVNSMEADTYNYSLDEDFQNFMADEETIIRRGVDESLVLPQYSIMPLNSMDDKHTQNICHPEEKNMPTTSSTDAEHQGDDHADNHTPSNNWSHYEKEADTLCTHEMKEQLTSEATDESNAAEHSKNHILMLKKPVTRSTKMRSSSNFITNMVESESHHSKHFYASPRRGEKHNTSQCFTNSNFLQLMKHRKSTSKLAARLSDSNDYTIYLDSSPSKTDTEKYLRRYKTLVNLNDVDNFKQITRNEICSGKENTCNSITPKREFRQTTQEKEFCRKPFQDRRNGNLGDIKNMSNSLEKRDIHIPLEDGHEGDSSEKFYPKDSTSHITKDESLKTNYPNKKIRKNRKKSRLRKKENLRL